MRGERLSGKLRGVRRRKRVRNGFACQVIAQKMRLVRETQKGRRRRRGA